MSARKFPNMFWLTAVAFASTLIIGDVAWAQQRFPINATADGVKSSYVQQHVIDVGDVTGHQVRILEVHRIHSGGQIVLNGVKVVEEWDRGFSDYTNGVGPAREDTGSGCWKTETRYSSSGTARHIRCSRQAARSAVLSTAQRKSWEEPAPSRKFAG